MTASRMSYYSTKVHHLCQRYESNLRICTNRSSNMAATRTATPTAMGLHIYIKWKWVTQTTLWNWFYLKLVCNPLKQLNSVDSFLHDLISSREGLWKEHLKEGMETCKKTNLQWSNCLKMNNKKTKNRRSLHHSCWKCNRCRIVVPFLFSEITL